MNVLEDEPIAVKAGESVLAAVRIDGLPERIDALGILWRRKVEFHVTVASVAKLESAAMATHGWSAVARVLDGRRIGPVTVRNELRRVAGHPDKPGLETVVVMVDAAGLVALYDELNRALGVPLKPPPAHVTIYSTDPEQGIGIDDERHLAERAPPLSSDQQCELQLSMGFTAVFGAPCGYEP